MSPIRDGSVNRMTAPSRRVSVWRAALEPSASDTRGVHCNACMSRAGGASAPWRAARRGSWWSEGRPCGRDGPGQGLRRRAPAAEAQAPETGRVESKSVLPAARQMPRQHLLDRPPLSVGHHERPAAAAASPRSARRRWRRPRCRHRCVSMRAAPLPPADENAFRWGAFERLRPTSCVSPGPPREVGAPTPRRILRRRRERSVLPESLATASYARARRRALPGLRPRPRATCPRARRTATTRRRRRAPAQQAAPRTFWVPTTFAVREVLPVAHHDTARWITASGRAASTARSTSRRSRRSRGSRRTAARRTALHDRDRVGPLDGER